ncbi:hypothetical protein SteCoe_25091 [Stentor coeruleus]|uniref:Uncharacterized protein n=1 Tax=Stentor coeruleus TaxID=5963 RepID=A0A1R2BG13_9CILI|nr:hypothetical protein SteCoe_25091 [Stentor coeruleus]
MNFKRERILLFVIGATKLIALTCHTLYVLFVKYQSLKAENISYYSFIVPFSFQILLYVYLLFNDSKNKRFYLASFHKVLLFAIGDFFGVNYFVFSLCFSAAQIKHRSFSLLSAMFWSSLIFNSAFQMIPQIAIQIYNNCLLSNWNIFNIFSLCISGQYIILTVVGYKFIIAKEEEFENIKTTIKSDCLANENKRDCEIAVEVEQNKLEVVHTIENLVCESY